MLIITKEQKALFTQTLLVRKIKRYLSKHLPEMLKNYPEDKLEVFIIKSSDQAIYFGIQSERCQSKWTYLNAITNGALIRVQGVRHYMEQSELSPDDKVDRLMRSIAVSAKLQESNIQQIWS